MAAISHTCTSDLSVRGKNFRQVEKSCKIRGKTSTICRLGLLLSSSPCLNISKCCTVICSPSALIASKCACGQRCQHCMHCAVLTAPCVICACRPLSSDEDQKGHKNHHDLDMISSSMTCNPLAYAVKLQVLGGKHIVLTNFLHRGLGVPTWLNFLRLQIAVAITMAEPYKQWSRKCPGIHCPV